LKPAITKDAQKFLATLVKKQDREWLKARKEEFEALLVQPVTQVLQEAGPLLMGAFPEVEDKEPKIFRIYRDIRFSKDKRPFKDHVGGELDLGPTSLYFHVGVDEVFAAVGPWMMEPDELKRYRAALADTPLGPALLRETQKLEKAGYELHSFDKLVKAPAGIAADHAVIELLRHKGYALVMPKPRAKALTDGTLPAFLAAAVIKAKPALDLVTKARRGA
jgi:uncharacterized protein (TIGR02453 family)